MIIIWCEMQIAKIYHDRILDNYAINEDNSRSCKKHWLLNSTLSAWEVFLATCFNLQIGFFLFLWNSSDFPHAKWTHYCHVWGTYPSIIKLYILCLIAKNMLGKCWYLWSHKISFPSDVQFHACMDICSALLFAIW